MKWLFHGYINKLSNYIQNSSNLCKLISVNYTSDVCLHTYVYLLNISRERHRCWLIINRRIIRQHSNYLNQFGNVCHNNYNFSIVQIATPKKMSWMINQLPMRAATTWVESVISMFQVLIRRDKPALPKLRPLFFSSLVVSPG